jgi:cell division septal protein FtsQ
VGSFAGAIRARRRVRIALLVALVSVPLMFGGWRWLRTSSLVSVDVVRVTGVHGPDAAQIAQALAAAGKRMTTLDVNQRALLVAVTPFHLVRSLSVSTSFPHGLRIRVVEQLPVATLEVAGARTAVAADGAVLGGALVSPSLPTVSGAYEPAPGALVHDPSLRAELEVLGAAPHALAPFMARAFESPRGLTVIMRDGLEAYFGDATRPHAKWLALALVLSDNPAIRVSAVDVRTPERAAAQFPAGSAPATAAGTTEASASGVGGSSESIATALAAGLATSAGYGSSAEAQSASAAKAAEALSRSHSTTTSESGSSSTSSGSGSESSAQRGSESSGSGSGEASGGTSGASPVQGG